MRKHHVIRNLTFAVWITMLSCNTLAAPQEPSPLLNTDEAVTTSPGTPDERMKEMDITRPPKQKPYVAKTENEKKYYYPYTRAMGPRLGLVFDPELLKDKKISYMIGFYYRFSSATESHIEAGADLLSTSKGDLFAVYNHFFDHTEKLRPFAKGGVSLLLDPNKGLANFVDYKQYNLLLGIGLEDLISDPLSLRWDIEGTIGIERTYVTVIFGYSWAW